MTTTYSNWLLMFNIKMECERDLYHLRYYTNFVKTFSLFTHCPKFAQPTIIAPSEMLKVYNAVPRGKIDQFFFFSFRYKIFIKACTSNEIETSLIYAMNFYDIFLQSTV